MFVYGLTGKSGSGKSTVAALLKENGFFVIDGDGIARQVTKKGSDVLFALSERFGADILNSDGSLNRKLLAEKAFAGGETVAALNGITHPAIDREISRQINKAASQGYKNCVIDAAALLESPSRRRCNKIIVVTAPEEIRLKRIINRDKLTIQQAQKRFNAQKDDNYYLKAADIIINNFSPYELNKEIEKIINGGIEMANEKTAAELLAEKLCAKNEHFSTRFENETEKADDFCNGYIDFLNTAKTERECNAFIIEKAERLGFEPYDRTKTYVPGSKVYYNNRHKSVILAVIGENGARDGVNIVASHIDSPRLDLKPMPLYEDSELAYFKTHYYGGIKKYQWPAMPLSLHGVVVLKDGTSVTVSIGENEGEAQFVVTDLLPHLSKEQNKRTLPEGIKGEELNILIGSRPFKSDSGSDLVKLNILKILNEKYGITESDFISAELELVPVFKANDIGFDRSLIGAYGHDDRVCAYPAFEALFGLDKTPQKTSIAVLTDKEEIGSDGNTGLNSSYLKYFIFDLAKAEGLECPHVLSKSQCLSADVNAGFDPTFPWVHDKRNAAFLNHGVVITKYTGSRGKAGTSDAAAEFMGKVRRILDGADVCWQTAELGAVDEGGGGTVAMYIANLDVDTVDLGVPVLSMHSPFEIVAKSDVYSAYKACKAFYLSE